MAGPDAEMPPAALGQDDAGADGPSPSTLYPSPLHNKRIVLGVSGSIAAYKAADLASKLRQAGALVDAVMTKGATEFITPLALRAVTGRAVITDMYDVHADLAVEHVELAHAAECVVIAPATAATLARLAMGLAEDMLSVTVLATTAPLVIAPAMEANMFAHPATQANLALLRQRGAVIVGPAAGHLASGRMGRGRMEQPETIVEAIKLVLGRGRDLAGRRIVVSAGGTQEPIDPVRYVSNHSSGKMGYAIAEAARDRGAAVTLITTPVALPPPYGVETVRVRRAVEMRDAVLAACRGADALIMAAAVADFQPAEVAGQKIKKRPGQTGLTLELTRTPDILADVAAAAAEREDLRRLVRVGFAAESQDLLANAAAKLHGKELAFIAANDITATDAGFGTDTNRVLLLDEHGAKQLPLLSKYDVALALLDRLLVELRNREQGTGNRGKRPTAQPV
ncbi:MAG TPA: bifunctional phosphopantothenoylcysteine decarboxylase/phosphopantothenate--cysteine ligase CoaBC [Dehalococcoidia bacterium]|nr:bifunctional phosphopantothenoylcysteine decarboxylase/phosphopantothenate--cysteine ligase CoaBC [Dehalococcoidia bacterium]